MPFKESLSTLFSRQTLGTALMLTVAIINTGCENNSHARHTSQADSGTGMEKIGARDAQSSPLQKWCSDCHAPPMPTAHKAQEWANVLARMQNHRVTEGLAKIDDQSLKTIIEYLESHAKP